MDSYIGRTLGNYRLIEQVGQGGMATVFKAYQPSMDRYVALKVLPSHFTQDATFVARFTQEAHTLARLEHPHILPVYDYGEQDGITYLVMRYIEAGTLRDLITERGALDLRQISRILGQVGRALGYAHDQGILHRDIKPSNVLIDPAGNAFLTDFGIAKIMAGAAHFTGTGAVIGTPAYMAPEQGMGKPLDHRCDIYALGVVLYEMVAGHVPFDAETPLAVMMMHVYNPLPLPRQTRKDLPEVIERITLKALAKSPEDRFQSVVEMVETLERATNGLPTGVSLPPIPGGPTAVYAPVPGAIPQPQPQMPPHVQSQPQVQLPEDRPTVVDDQGARASEMIASKTLPQGQRSPKFVGMVLTKLRTLPWPLVAGLVLLIPLVIAAIVWGGAIFGDESDSGGSRGGVILSTALLIDNGDPAFAVDSGEWDFCNNGDCGGMSYDADFRYAEPGCLECRASFHFSIAETGLYDVLTWWPRDDDRARDTPFTLAYDGISTTLTVDQRRYGGGWYLLATLPLTAGTRLDVSVAGTTSGFANADAVRLTPAEGWRYFGDYNAFRALSLQGDDVWAGGEAGLVHWNLEASSYEIVTVVDGLPSNQVYDVLLDEEDRLWVATDAGVARFADGQWTTFDHQDGLDSPNVVALLEGEEGGIWAATTYSERSLNYYDGQRWVEPPIPGLPMERPWILDITADDDWGFFVGLEYNGVAHYAENEWTLLEDEWMDDRSVRVVTLVDDDLYFGFNSGAARLSLRNPGEIEVFPALEWSTIFSIHYADDDTLWFGGEGLYHYDPQDGTWDDFSAEDCPGLAWRVRDIGEFRDRLLFVTEGGGLWAYEDSTWSSWEVPTILQGNVSSIVQSEDGTLWFSHAGRGVTRYHPETGARQTFGPRDGVGGVFGVLGVDAQDRVWVNSDGTLHFYDGRRWQTLEADAIADSRLYGVMFDSEDVMWVPADAFLARYDPRDDTWTKFTEEDNPVLGEIITVFVAADDTLWVGGAGGLAHFDGETWQTVKTEGFSGTRVNAVTGAPDGSLWFAVDGNLQRLFEGTWESYDWQYYATRLHVAPDGIVWAWGSEGVGRYDPEHYSWDILTMEDGLISNEVTALWSTPEGVLWIGTKVGVNRYVP